MTTMPPLPPQPHHRRRRHGAAVSFPLPLLLLLSIVCSAGAQPSPGSSSPPGIYNAYGRFNPSMAIIIVVLISAFFFMGFFSIYLRQCGERADASIRPAGPLGGRSRRAAAPRGLAPDVIETFPTLVYSDVKEHKIGKEALECAVCLSEFEDDDTLRLLPRCDHVFHPDCIDAWLSAHTTCPVCRSNLADTAPVAPSASDAATPSATEGAGVGVDAGAGDDPAVDGASGDQSQREGDADIPCQSDHVAITIEVPVAPEPGQKVAESSATPRAAERMRRVESKSRLPWRSKSSLRPPKFPRSHSTGHSMVVVQPGEDHERYTLRLPEHIRKDIMAGKLQRSSSCAAFPAGTDGSTRKGGAYGGGEGSSLGGGSMGGRSFKLRRWEWVAKSDRWAFFARTFSMKISRGDAAEGSTRRGEGSARRGVEGGDAAAEGSVRAKVLPGVRSPFDCLGGGDGAADAAATSPTKAVGAAQV